MFEWATPPLISGLWKTLTKEDQIDFVLKINESVYLRSVLGQFEALGVRILKPSFYPGHVLVEMAAKATENSHVLIANFIYGPQDILPLDGQSMGIHILNNRKVLYLGSEQARLDYVNFFCSAVRGGDDPNGEQRFRIVSRIEDIGLDEIPKEVAEYRFRPNELRHAEHGSYRFKVAVVYGNALFESNMSLNSKGQVEMLSDEMICELPMESEVFVAPWRIYQRAEGPTAQSSQIKDKAQ